jgi:lysophospholipase L1-like esterase
MSDTSPDRSSPTEELVAYLDGELGAEESRKVERLLADDPRVRVELSRLDQTWELLDRLPRAQLDPIFTRSTVEMIAVSAADEVEQQRAAEPLRRRRRWWLASGGVLLAALAGLWSGEKLASYPNQRLLDDVSVLTNLEAYRQTADLAFLRDLAQGRSMVDEPDGEAVTLAPGTSEARRKYLETMDSRDKEQVLRKQKTFGLLSPVEQARLRRLDAELARADDAAELRVVLGQFQHWLNRLSAPERAHLQHAQSSGQRLADVKLMRENEAKRLGPDDAHEFAQWWLDLIKSRQPNQRKAFQGLKPEKQHEQMRLRLLDQNSQVRKIVLQRLPSPDEFAPLRSKLSDEANQQLDRAEDPAAKRQLLRIWLQDGFHLRAGGRAPSATAVEISDDQLHEFFVRLPDMQQNEMLRLPPEEMFRRLQRRFADGQRETNGSARKPKSEAKSTSE